MKRAMKALGLALSLRVIGTRVTDPDAQADQPDRKARVAAELIAPGLAVVHRHPVRQAVLAKDLYEHLLDEDTSLPSQGAQCDVKARVVIDDIERIAAPTQTQPHMALEVHLPEIIRVRVLEALEGGLPLQHFIRARQTPVAVQDRRDRAGTGDLGVALVD